MTPHRLPKPRLPQRVKAFVERYPQTLIILGTDDGGNALDLLRSAADALERAEQQLAEADAVIWAAYAIDGEMDDEPFEKLKAQAIERHASRQGAPQPQTREEETRG